MPLQRRYSVTGQTPPDHVEAMKSPKLQGLDTSVQTAGCNLCECDPDDATTRTSSKRCATQIPSSNTPTSLELPTKIAKLGLHHDEGYFSCPLSQEDLPLSPWPVLQPAPEDNGALSDADDSAIDVGPDLPSLAPTETPASLTLCGLPPELRHHIYLLLPDLVQDHPLIYCLSTFSNKKQHALASVSRLIRSEALAIFYSYNTWIIKLEYKIMFDSFQTWIIRLGDAAGHLRVVQIAVRGSLFKPRSSHAARNEFLATVLIQPRQHGLWGSEAYRPPDGDASFRVDLSEKWTGGRVEVLRNDGTSEAGEKARLFLGKLVVGLWEKRCAGTLNGQDWVYVVDQFLEFVGWR